MFSRDGTDFRYFYIRYPAGRYQIRYLRLNVWYVLPDISLDIKYPAVYLVRYPVFGFISNAIPGFCQIPGFRPGTNSGYLVFSYPGYP